MLTDLWESGAANAMGHIAVSRGADAIVVAPASADFLAKLAQGHADDLLSTLCLARECPLLVAPAMNRQMWANAATQRNVAQLAQDGVAILGPDTGELACKENGEGRMLEPEELFAALVASRAAEGARRQARAADGGTDVRGDRSGARHHQFELRQDGLRAGAGGGGSRRAGDASSPGPTSLATPPGVTRIDVTSAAQMADAVLGRIDRRRHLHRASRRSPTTRRRRRSDRSSRSRRRR